MNSPVRLLAACSLVAAVLTMSGCVSAETLKTKPATGVWGYVAAAKHASIELDPARASTVGLVVKRVVAPADCLVVVTVNDPSNRGMQAGVAAIKRGETEDVKIPLQDVMTWNVTATLYLDRGRKGIFDFDMMDPASSPDRPIFVGGNEVAASTPLWQPGRPAKVGKAVLDVFDQSETSGTLTVAHVITPRPSWITVSTDASGTLGELIGSRSIGATQTSDVAVPLSNATYRGRVWVGLHADAGARGTLEYDRYGDLATSPDQLYRVSGRELLVGAELR